MTKEQQETLKTTLGVLEEGADELQQLGEQLDKEWESMTEKQQEENQDFCLLVNDVCVFSSNITDGIGSVIDSLEKIEGSITE